MAYIIPALILCFCAPVVFLRASVIRGIVCLAAISLVTGLGAWAWVRWMPANFLVDHPALADSPLHPQIASLGGCIAVLFGIGLFIALGCRYLLQTIGILKKNP